eukprot:7242351-Pyramimonas_sp.AAC.1
MRKACVSTGEPLAHAGLVARLLLRLLLLHLLAGDVSPVQPQDAHEPHQPHDAPGAGPYPVRSTVEPTESPPQTPITPPPVRDRLGFRRSALTDATTRWWMMQEAGGGWTQEAGWWMQEAGGWAQEA